MAFHSQSGGERGTFHGALTIALKDQLLRQTRVSHGAFYQDEFIHHLRPRQHCTSGRADGDIKSDHRIQFFDANLQNLCECVSEH
eukprot:759024-Hanusia_phi.AAC.2